MKRWRECFKKAKALQIIERYQKVIRKNYYEGKQRKPTEKNIAVMELQMK